MKCRNISQYMEISAELKEGEDFTKDQLVPDQLTADRMWFLPGKVCKQVAVAHGFDECTWSGHYDQESESVEVVLRKKVIVQRIPWATRSKSEKDFTEKQS